MYFLAVGVRRQSVFHDYLLTSIHLEHLEAHRIYTDYEELERLYVSVLKMAKTEEHYLMEVLTLDIDKLPFERRKLVPEAELLLLEIVTDYIATAKQVLGEEQTFGEIAPKPYHSALASTRYMFGHQNMNGVVGLVMSVLDGSRSAFAQGDLGVHRAYLRLGELLKKIYLSYAADRWLFPADILLYIPLRYFVEVSDDIMPDVKKTLFQMVNHLG